jgi:hypothetical protein
MTAYTMQQHFSYARNEAWVERRHSMHHETSVYKLFLRSAIHPLVVTLLPPPTLPLLKGKSKVKLSLCLTKHHAMKAYWGSGGIAPRIL